MKIASNTDKTDSIDVMEFDLHFPSSTPKYWSMIISTYGVNGKGLKTFSQ
jgi:hypothetical protein